MADEVNLETAYLIGDYYTPKSSSTRSNSTRDDDETTGMTKMNDQNNNCYGKNVPDSLFAYKTDISSLNDISLHETSLSSINEMKKYHNLGLSLNSQELINEYYQGLVMTDSNRTRPFEEILYSIIEDIQAYKKDVSRLEQSLRNEKEHNEEILKQMIEEADHQLSESIEKIRNEERDVFERLTNKMKEQFHTETNILHENLMKVKRMNEMYEKEKSNDDMLAAERNKELQEHRTEVNSLRLQLREAQTQISILRSDLAELKQQQHDENNEENVHSSHLIESHREIRDLKDEIKALHEANKKLNDSNDLLRDEIESIRIKSTKAVLAKNETISNTDESIAESSCSTSSISNELIRKSNESIQRSESLRKSLPSSQTTLKVNGSSHSPVDTDEDVGIFELNGGYFSGVSNVSPFSAQMDVAYSSKRSSMYGLNEGNPNNMSHLFELSLLNGVNECDAFMENMLNRNENIPISSRASFSNGQQPSSRRQMRLRSTSRANSNSSRHLNSLASSIGQDLKKTPERMFKVVFAGDAAVGKTSFIMRFCKNEFLPTISSTLGVDFHMKMLDIDNKMFALQLWDTCGQERYRSIAKSYFRQADGIVLMYDCTYERSFLNIREWIVIINDNNDKQIPIVLVASKTDLRESLRQANKRVIEYDEGLKLARECGALFVETSAKSGTNMEESLIELSKAMSCNQDIQLKTDVIQLTPIQQKRAGTCCSQAI